MVVRSLASLLGDGWQLGCGGGGGILDRGAGAGAGAGCCCGTGTGSCCCCLLSCCLLLLLFFDVLAPLPHSGDRGAAVLGLTFNAKSPDQSGGISFEKNLVPHCQKHGGSLVV